MASGRLVLAIVISLIREVETEYSCLIRLCLATKTLFTLGSVPALLHGPQAAFVHAIQCSDLALISHHIPLVVNHDY